MRTGPHHPPPVSAAMRTSHVTTVAAVLALSLLAPAAPARAGDAPRELVVQLSAGALESPGMSLRSVGALPTAVRRRFAALGLHASRAFAEALATSRRPLLLGEARWHVQRFRFSGRRPSRTLTRSVR